MRSGPITLTWSSALGRPGARRSASALARSGRLRARVRLRLRRLRPARPRAARRPPASRARRRGSAASGSGVSVERRASGSGVGFGRGARQARRRRLEGSARPAARSAGSSEACTVSRKSISSSSAGGAGSSGAGAGLASKSRKSVEAKSSSGDAASQAPGAGARGVRPARRRLLRAHRPARSSSRSGSSGIERQRLGLGTSGAALGGSAMALGRDVARARPPGRRHRRRAPAARSARRCAGLRPCCGRARTASRAARRRRWLRPTWRSPCSARARAGEQFGRGGTLVGQPGVEHLLEGPGGLAEVHQPDHARAALERVEGAAQHGQLAAVVRPRAERRHGGQAVVQHFAGLVQEDVLEVVFLELRHFGVGQAPRAAPGR